MKDPERIGLVLAWIIVLAALASFAVMFSQRAHPPEKEMMR